MSGLSWILAFAGFAFLVIAHELGHFTVAKLVGMRVEKFSLFFPPTLASVKRGETEYAIGAIPAGGYVKISGMNPDEDLPEEVRDRAYHAQPVWKRIAVIAAGPGGEPGPGAGAAVRVLRVRRAPGPSTEKVDAIEGGYPAATVLKTGDRIVSVDGRAGRPGEALAADRDAQVRRDAPEGLRRGVAGRARGRARRAHPAGRRPADLRPGGQERTRLGFGFRGPRSRSRSGEAFTTSLDRFWFVTKQTVALPARLFDAKERKEISGIVGSYEVTRQTILVDFGRVVAILALISLSLAIINLFPFLPLDGGHIFWAIVEKVRGRPVPLAVMERAGVVGMVLVLGLFILGLSNDIDRLTGEGFQVR